MKVNWVFAILLALALGVIISAYIVQPSTSKLLLQSHLAIKDTLPTTTFELPLSNIVPPRKPSEAAQKPMLKNHSVIENKPTESLHAPLPKKSKKLDLTLPKEWDNSAWKASTEAIQPNFFRPKNIRKFSVSSKLIWDESEEAQSLPIEKTIDGAEFELQFRLP